MHKVHKYIKSVWLSYNKKIGWDLKNQHLGYKSTKSKKKKKKNNIWTFKAPHWPPYKQIYFDISTVIMIQLLVI